MQSLSRHVLRAMHVCFHGDREHGEGIGRGGDQLPGRGLPATVPGGEAAQGRGEAGTTGIQNILLSHVGLYMKKQQYHSVVIDLIHHFNEESQVLQV